MGGGSGGNQRDPVADYRGGITAYLDNLPRLLEAERGARDAYDPVNIERALHNEELYRTRDVRDQLGRYHQVDPTGSALRESLISQTSADLANGYQIPDALRTQGQQAVRGAQAARGNILGNSAGNQEAVYTGQQAFDMHNRRLANAGSALSTAGPLQYLGTGRVTPDRSAQYTVGASTAGNAGVGWGQQLFNQQQQGSNPWAGALSGAASGAAVGAVGGPWTALAGGLIGGAAGYFSDRRLKTDIRQVRTSAQGHNVYHFRYTGDPNSRVFEGVMADEVLKIAPDAVGKTDDGWLCVDYGQLDVPFREVA